MMQSKKSVKSAEECSAKRIPETSDQGPLERRIVERRIPEDYVGLKETCPFQDQAKNTDMDGPFVSVHCRSDCAWYSDDQCCIWDLIAALQGIRTKLEQLTSAPILSMKPILVPSER